MILVFLHNDTQHNVLDTERSCDECPFNRITICGGFFGHFSLFSIFSFPLYCNKKYCKDPSYIIVYYCHRNLWLLICFMIKIFLPGLCTTFKAGFLSISLLHKNKNRLQRHFILVCLYLTKILWFAHFLYHLNFPSWPIKNIQKGDFKGWKLA